MKSCKNMWSEFINMLGDEARNFLGLWKGVKKCLYRLFFFAFQKKGSLLTEKIFMKWIGLIPEFKAGNAWRGTSSYRSRGNKKGIAYHGDVINTARLDYRNECSKLWRGATYFWGFWWGFKNLKLNIFYKANGEVSPKRKRSSCSNFFQWVGCSELKSPLLRGDLGVCIFCLYFIIWCLEEESFHTPKLKETCKELRNNANKAERVTLEIAKWETVFWVWFFHRQKHWVFYCRFLFARNWC